MSSVGDNAEAISAEEPAGSTCIPTSCRPTSKSLPLQRAPVRTQACQAPERSPVPARPASARPGPDTGGASTMPSAQCGPAPVLSALPLLRRSGTPRLPTRRRLHFDSPRPVGRDRRLGAVRRRGGLAPRGPLRGVRPGRPGSRRALRTYVWTVFVAHMLCSFHPLLVVATTFIGSCFPLPVPFLPEGGSSARRPSRCCCSPARSPPRALTALSGRFLPGLVDLAPGRLGGRPASQSRLTYWNATPPSPRWG